jgi:hypothetical protein
MSSKPPVRFAFIPDTQIRPGVSTVHVAWAARYLAEKRPAAIIVAGDWHDMPSLSSYDKGKKSAEGRRYKADITAGNVAIEMFESELKKYAPKGYAPKKYVTLGNHENRIVRAIEEDPSNDAYSLDDLAWKQHGWHVQPFLKPLRLSGINFVHYCCLNAKGQVMSSKNGAPSAEAQVRRFGRSTVCGHKQGLDLGVAYAGDRIMTGVIAGSFYSHSEAYLTPQGDLYYRGIVMCNDVRADGSFDPCPVSLRFLKRKFG